MRLQTTLGVGLEAFVKDRRASTPRRSWRLIARDLYDATGRDVAYVTLRSWFPDPEPATAEAAS